MSRPRWIEQLNTGLNRKLTLTFAPSGSGTATLTIKVPALPPSMAVSPLTALHGDLPRIRNMSLPLISVNLAELNSKGGALAKFEGGVHTG